MDGKQPRGLWVESMTFGGTFNLTQIQIQFNCLNPHKMTHSFL